MSKIRILFLAANPLSTTHLDLGVEIRTIDERLRTAALRDNFELEQQWAVRPGDLQEGLLRYKPHIVHFSGHGSSQGQLILQDNAGQAQPVSPGVLAELFRTLKGNIRCVVMNACWSAAQAQSIAQEIDCVVGMSRTIDDSAAIRFAEGFYRGIGYGESLQTAFELGKNSIHFADPTHGMDLGSPTGTSSVFDFFNPTGTNNPFNVRGHAGINPWRASSQDTPQILHRHGVDPAQIVIAARADASATVDPGQFSDPTIRNVAQQLQSRQIFARTQPWNEFVLLLDHIFDNLTFSQPVHQCASLGWADMVYVSYQTFQLLGAYQHLVSQAAATLNPDRISPAYRNLKITVHQYCERMGMNLFKPPVQIGATEAGIKSESFHRSLEERAVKFPIRNGLVQIPQENLQPCESFRQNVLQAYEDFKAATRNLPT